MAIQGKTSPGATLSAAIIPLGNIRPYLSAVLLMGSSANRDLADKLIREAALRIVSNKTATRKILDGPSIDIQNGFVIGSIFYKEKSRPVWDSGGHFYDVTHQFVWLVVRDKQAALIASDSAIRESIVKSIKSASVIDRDMAFNAFVGNQARAIWLNGTHAKTDVKPESKMLMGTALEEALDPLGDHSYHLSALRSQPMIPAMQSKTLGVALSAGRVWSVRTKSLQDLLIDVGALFDQLANPPARLTSYDFLSQPIFGLLGVEKAYSVSVLPSLLLDGSDAGASADEINQAQEWAYESKYMVQPGVDSNFKVQVMHRGTDIGTLEIHPKSMGSIVSLVGAGWQPVDLTMKEVREEAERYLLDEKQVKVHYESGHTIGGGACFKGGFVDQLVDWKWQDFNDYDIDREKPVPSPTLAASIGLPTDRSLFGFVVRSAYKRGWLTCDDGAGEVGDFVHLDPAARKITLIHAKAASSKDPVRGFSVSDYDVVVAQAIRNIRHLDKDNLLKSLKKSKGYAIASATWKDGLSATRAQFITELEKLGANFSKELVILQPQLTRAKHAECLGQNVSKGLSLRFKQVNSLVQGAAMAAFGVGATFVAYACE